MATCINDSDFRSKLAGENLTDYQFRFVTLETDDQLDYADSTTAHPYGVLQTPAATQNTACNVKVSGESQIEAGEAVAVNAIVQTDATGRAIALSTGGFAKGRCVSAAGAAADLAVIEILNTGIASA